MNTTRNVNRCLIPPPIKPSHFNMLYNRTLACHIIARAKTQGTITFQLLTTYKIGLLQIMTQTLKLMMWMNVFKPRVFHGTKLNSFVEKVYGRRHHDCGDHNKTVVTKITKTFNSLFQYPLFFVYDYTNICFIIICHMALATRCVPLLRRGLLTFR